MKRIFVIGFALSMTALFNYANGQQPQQQRRTLSELLADGFEIKTALRDALVVSKGQQVYACELILGVPLGSNCVPVR